MAKDRKRDVAQTVQFDASPVDQRQLARHTGSLVVVQGADADLGLHVVVEAPVVIGREAEVELPLRDGSTSRRHCQVDREPQTGTYLVRDLGSTNGTRLNGVRVEGPTPLRDGDKIFLGATIVKFSLTDELDVEYLTRLDALVATDALTGLLTRRRFDGAFATAVLAARSAGQPLACLVMDMDGLKTINDAHGHELGGYCIVEVADLLRGVIGERGALCRYGGDEFVAFLPGRDKAGARPLAEAMRAAVAGHVFEQRGIRVTPTLSVGIAALPTEGTTPSELFRAADLAMYRAKAAGKNQVSLA